MNRFGIRVALPPTRVHKCAREELWCSCVESLDDWIMNSDVASLICCFFVGATGGGASIFLELGTSQRQVLVSMDGSNK